MISFFPKSKALKSYVHILPRILKKTHGKRKQYSKDEILDAIKTANLNPKYCDYALAIYMSKQSYNSLELKKLGDYKRLRKEVAKKFFKGNEFFKIHDLLALSKIHLSGQKIVDPTEMQTALGDSIQDYYDGDGD